MSSIDEQARATVVVPTADGKAERIIHRRLDRVEERLPRWLAAWVVHLRRPSASWLRVPLGVLLVLGGVFSFLPIFGLWMLPLGLLLLALDFALLRRPTAQMIVGGERGWRRLRRRWWGDRGGGAAS